MNPMMKTLNDDRHRLLGILCFFICCFSCKVPDLVSTRSENKNLPASFTSVQTARSNASTVKWKDYFKDGYLTSLIDTALKNNQELAVTLQEIEIARNEIMARQGEYKPFMGYKGGIGVDKTPRYTNLGALEKNVEIAPDKETPEPLFDYLGAATASWEIDIWHKLRNATKAAQLRYLSTIEGRNFVITNLIAEIANSYYELVALDNQLSIVKSNLELQTKSLELVKVQKEAAHVTELAVKKFEAELLNTQSLQYDILQRITETENKINFLLGRYPRPIPRDASLFNSQDLASIQAGVPSQLLANRADIRQAEKILAASKIDVQVARARFFPSLGISANLGLNAFNPIYLVKVPESILGNLVGDIAGPLINKNAIKSDYFNANAKQVQAVYNYERTILNAYMEVANQVAKSNNLKRNYEYKSQEVAALVQSIDISNQLFKSAKADYLEVLHTQRDALESKFELIETQKMRMNNFVNIYKALGGGWY